MHHHSSCHSGLQVQMVLFQVFVSPSTLEHTIGCLLSPPLARQNQCWAGCGQTWVRPQLTSQPNQALWTLAVTKVSNSCKNEVIGITSDHATVKVFKFCDQTLADHS